MSEINTNPSVLSIFQKSDLNAGIFGRVAAGARTERHAQYANVVWGTFAELYFSGATQYGLIPPSLYTTELIGVQAISNDGTQANIANQIAGAGSIGTVIKEGYVICRMDVDNKPNVGQAVSVNLNAGKIGYVTGLTSGGVLNIAKGLAKVVAVYDTHCEVELAGNAVIACTYAA